ncbi:type VI secretion system contractile sheath large subunit [Francisella frigiditurris]|uniref:Type VI secretion system contractile sheath large subunit n=1 Tax=Francisella frigiditurris TaxID=1542390 RepID=A0A1J0KRN3_9GAMM|nr:type VI secretion system contractile sheath large subunit [Francisella frigiditurris]APC96421.1 hypothetical protein KX01_1295 [Francisella frigiditurris]
MKDQFEHIKTELLYNESHSDLSNLQKGKDIFENLSNLNDVLSDYNVATLSTMMLVLLNNEDSELGISEVTYNKVLAFIDELVAIQIESITDNELFRKLKANWKQIFELNSEMHKNTNITLFDVSKKALKEELAEDRYTLTKSSLYNKIYTEEYGTYGGEPYGLLCGLYDMENTADDISFLVSMGNIAKLAHSPFIASIDNNFFGINKEQFSEIRNFEDFMQHPKFNDWNSFREMEIASYIGLTFGKYILDLPKDPTNNPCQHPLIKNFKSSHDYLDSENFLWGYSSILFAKNVMRSFEKSGWFQHIRGPENGGLVTGLNYPKVIGDNFVETRNSVDVLIPDYLELSLSKVGFMSLVMNKSLDKACFFNVQSAKKVIDDFEDDFDSANSALVANLSYVMCVSKIAHYIKCVIREKIGSVVSKDIISDIITSWINNYVTIIESPNIMEMARFPFKYVNVDINPVPGKPGWYSSSIEILPHIQFEGLNVKMKLESRLDPQLFNK